MQTDLLNNHGNCVRQDIEFFSEKLRFVSWLVLSLTMYICDAEKGRGWGP